MLHHLTKTGLLLMLVSLSLTLFAQTPVIPDDSVEDGPLAAISIQTADGRISALDCGGDLGVMLGSTDAFGGRRLLVKNMSGQSLTIKIEVLDANGDLYLDPNQVYPYYVKSYTRLVSNGATLGATIQLLTQQLGTQSTQIKVTVGKQKEVDLPQICYFSISGRAEAGIPILGHQDLMYKNTINYGFFFMDLIRTQVGTTIDQEIMLQNGGTAPLLIDQISLRHNPNAPLSLTGPLPSAIPPGEQAAVTVRFSPQAEVGYDFQLVVKSNDPDKPVALILFNARGTAKTQGQLAADGKSLHTNVQSVIYPTVSSDYVTLETSAARHLRQYHLLDAHGRILSSLSLPAEQTRLLIDVSGLQKGMYYLGSPQGETLRVVRQ